MKVQINGQKFPFTPQSRAGSPLFKKWFRGVHEETDAGVAMRIDFQKKLG